jgi:hypothetical protein
MPRRIRSPSPWALVLVTAFAALACSQRPAGGERTSPTAAITTPAAVAPGAPHDAGAIDRAAPAAAAPQPGRASRCAAQVDAARAHLAHRATWRKTWSGGPPQCKEACVVQEEQPPDADGNVYRYHLVIPAQGGGFDVIENVGLGPAPEKCGQFSTWETVVGGEPLHVRLTHLISAGMAFDQAIDDAGEPVMLGWHCAREGSESEITDLFIDRARHERALVVTQHLSGEDEAEVTASGGAVRIHGAGCDERRPLGGRP